MGSVNNIEDFVKYLSLGNTTSNDNIISLWPLEWVLSNYNLELVEIIKDDFSDFNYFTISNDVIYADDTGEVTLFYHEVPPIEENGVTVNQYRCLNDFSQIITDVSDLIPIDLFQNSVIDKTLYCHKETTVIYYRSIDMVTISIRHSILYNPKDFTNFPDGSYKLNYRDHEGYTNDWGDISLKVLSALIFKGFNEKFNYRNVEIKRGNQAAKLSPYPTIVRSSKSLYYSRKDSPVLGQFGFDDIAKIPIRLHFETIYGLLEFLNQTIFNYTEAFEKDSTPRGIFYNQYIWLVKSNIEVNTFEEKLRIIYHVPEFALLEINKQDLWDILGKMLSVALTNIETNTEDIAIKLLSILRKKENHDTIFLRQLLSKKINKESYFNLLYRKVDGDNFVKLIIFLRDAWLNSFFIDPNREEFKLTNSDSNPDKESEENDTNLVASSPIFLPYKSKKFIGFYSSNKEFDFYGEEHLKVTPDDKWIDDVITFFSPSLGKLVKYFVEDKTTYYYHYFFPIMLTDVEQESAIELPTLIPAFFLKANEDKAFWSNVLTSLEYGADILTTFSGVGNLAKFRHLNKLVKLGKVVSKQQKAVSYIRLGAGFIEVSSGSLSMMIKLSGTTNPYALALQKYLFYLELLSLGGELTVAIRGGLQKSAKEVLEHKDALRKSAKNADEAKQIDNLIEELIRIVGEMAEYVSEFVKKLPKNAAVFVTNVVAKVPGLETRIVNGLLEAHFKGVTWFKMNPRGIMVELNFTRKFPKESTYKTPVAELKKVEVELTYLDNKGKEIVKKYTDDIEVLLSKDRKTGIETFTFRPKFEEGKVRDTDFINYTFKRTEEQVLDTGEIIYKEPPYAVKPTSSSKAVDKILKEGDEFYIVEYMNRERPGGFATNVEITTEKELRNLLQVTEDMKKTLKDNPFVVRQYRVREGQQLYTREGYIGNLKTGQATGPKQWEFLELWDIDFEDNVLEVINVKNLK